MMKAEKKLVLVGTPCVSCPQNHAHDSVVELVVNNGSVAFMASLCRSCAEKVIRELDSELQDLYGEVRSE